MEKFVIGGKNKRSCPEDAPSPRKMNKLELCSDEEVKDDAEDEEFSHPVPWQNIEAEGLDCDYALLFSKKEADHLFKQLEEEVVYSTGTSAIFSTGLKAFTGNLRVAKLSCLFCYSRGRS